MTSIAVTISIELDVKALRDSLRPAGGSANHVVEAKQFKVFAGRYVHRNRLGEVYSQFTRGGMVFHGTIDLFEQTIVIPEKDWYDALIPFAISVTVEFVNLVTRADQMIAVGIHMPRTTGSEKLSYEEIFKGGDSIRAEVQLATNAIVGAYKYYILMVDRKPDERTFGAVQAFFLQILKGASTVSMAYGPVPQRW